VHPYVAGGAHRGARRHHGGGARSATSASAVAAAGAPERARRFVDKRRAPPGRPKQGGGVPIKTEPERGSDTLTKRWCDAADTPVRAKRRPLAEGRTGLCHSLRDSIFGSTLWQVLRKFNPCPISGAVEACLSSSCPHRQHPTATDFYATPESRPTGGNCLRLPHFRSHCHTPTRLVATYRRTSFAACFVPRSLTGGAPVWLCCFCFESISGLAHDCARFFHFLATIKRVPFLYARVPRCW